MLAITFGSTVVIPVAFQSIIALFVPVVVALVTRFRAGNTKVHAAVALVLTALLAVWALLADNVPNDTVLDVVAAFFGTIVPAVVAYLTVVRPTNLNARLAPNKGV